LLARRLNPARRHRSNPRVAKRKYVKWRVKRERHKTWPQPTRRPQARIPEAPSPYLNGIASKAWLPAEDGRDHPTGGVQS